MGNQIVALEHEAHRVVPVGVPVSCAVFFCGNTVDDQLAAVIPVQTADHVEQRCFAGAAGTQDRHEFIVPQAQTDSVQRLLNQGPGFILFFDVLYLEHLAVSFPQIASFPGLYTLSVE